MLGRGGYSKRSGNRSKLDFGALFVFFKLNCYTIKTISPRRL